MLSMAFLFVTSICLADTTISGRVTDSSNNQPIPKATVKISAAGITTIYSLTTDSNGCYKINLKLKKPRFGKEVACSIFVSAKGYISATKASFIKPDKAYTFNFSLKRAFYYNRPPKIKSFSPSTHSTFITTDAISISATAEDADNDVLYYCFWMDDKRIRDWAVSSSYNLGLTAKDAGEHNIKVEVKDNKGGTDSKVSNIYVYIALPKPQ